MAVIKKLGDRVEREHLQHLRDSQRIEDRSVSALNSSASGGGLATGLDFESLVGGAKTSTVKPDSVIENGKSWDDDVWGSILNGNEVCYSFPPYRLFIIIDLLNIMH